MDTALFGVLLGFGLGVIFKTVDILIQWRGQRRLAEEHAQRQAQWEEDYAQSRAEQDARWQELDERHRRIASLVKSQATGRAAGQEQRSGEKTEEGDDEAVATLKVERAFAGLDQKLLQSEEMKFAYTAVQNVIEYYARMYTRMDYLTRRQMLGILNQFTEILNELTEEKAGQSAETKTEPLATEEGPIQTRT